MQPRPGTTQTLARFVVDTKWEDIPAEAHEAKRALLNFFAVALAGCRTEPVELALKSLSRVLRRPAGDDRRPARAHRCAERGVPQRRRRQRLRLLRHAPADGRASDLAARARGAGDGRAAQGHRPAVPDRLRAGLRDGVPDRRRCLARPLSRRAGTSPRPAACSPRPRRPASCSASASSRWCGRWARRRRSRPACASASAGRPRASASAMPRATACGRRCWRRRASPARPSRSPARRASSR